MSKIYEKATPAELDLLSSAISQYHPVLLTANAVIAMTFVRKLDDNDDPVRCLKHHGAQCAAYIRPTATSAKLRLDHDAEIFIDGCLWDELPQASRLALLDHELTHLVPIKTKAGLFKKDDRGRQVLRNKADDFTLTGFIEVVRRHGPAALELKSVESVTDDVAQALASYSQSTGAATLTTAVTNANPVHATVINFNEDGTAWTNVLTPEQRAALP